MKKALLGSLVSAALLTSFNLSAASAGQAVDAQAATDNASKVSQQKIDNYAESAESALAQYKAALRQGLPTAAEAEATEATDAAPAKQEPPQDDFPPTVYVAPF